MPDDTINRNALYFSISSFVQVKEFEKAKTFYSKLASSSFFNTLDSNGFFNVGLVESMLGENEIALSYYNRSIELDSNNVSSLSNRGFYL